jgi:hypothetical protein
MAGLTEQAPDNFAQRCRSGTSLSVQSGFAAIVGNVKTKACDLKRPLKCGELRVRQIGFCRANPALERHEEQVGTLRRKCVTPLVNRLEATNPARASFSALEMSHRGRVKATRGERFANFLPLSVTSISFLRSGCGAGATKPKS